ncbi:WD40 repeat-like protein [Dichomitus squalens LYAD-421 SS1]|uniref:WD40 repeat-like protein n=1 Tax=Dichomitus squalens (strain LYAD-421) TaxID=732165 RepID=R7T251_DICSQ|nr:WD40 repeat-like protein [Dichomitus squalens LYAD-421 SS1]EJF61237.1 WD40 repeat-like protein [Dichomitus squalens LYAD-421 SS1]
MRSPSIDTVLTASSLPPSRFRPYEWKERLLSVSYTKGGLDRVKVLGSDATGHTGCVNALSWAKGGEVLISSGDDVTVRLWRMDRDNTQEDYPFKCDTVIHTGHRGNVFNAQMLPHSSRIATVSGDSQVRVFDHEKAAGSPGNNGETEYSTRQAAIRIFRCHSGRTKRIVTEDSPDLFLTVSEDGTVRQHDLRVPHSCQGDACPAPLVALNCELSTLSLSPLTPYQFVVAGESPYGYLFDRRHAGRQFAEEWGQPPDSSEVTTCVRRFGRHGRGSHERRGREHITGSRMASSNGHEVLLSYSADGIYLYSTKDDPGVTSMASGESSIVPPNKKRSPPRDRIQASNSEVELMEERSARDIMMEDDIERMLSEHVSPPRTAEQEPLLGDEAADEEDPEARLADNNSDEEEDEDMDEAEERQGDTRYSSVPTILPRARFSGICNVETVKDVNFLGPRDEYVVSGSDDGNWFMWEKDTGRLHDILEGDGSVVNVIEGHPYLPLVAVSGIDLTVKLFASTPGPSRFSRLDKSESIINRNAQAARPRRSDLSSLILYYRLARRMAEEGDAGGGADLPQCTFQ